jgi:hypothetical protein
LTTSNSSGCITASARAGAKAAIDEASFKNGQIEGDTQTSIEYTVAQARYVKLDFALPLINPARHDDVTGQLPLSQFAAQPLAGALQRFAIRQRFQAQLVHPARLLGFVELLGDADE